VAIVDPVGKQAPIGRRVVLGMLGVGGAGILLGAKAQDVLERVLAPLTSRDGTGLSSLLPVGRFRIYTVTGDLPSRGDGDYRLSVAGHVDNPFEMNAPDLRAMPPTHLKRDFQCVTGWRVHDVNWSGVRLVDLLDRAGVRQGAGGVEFGSFDGRYTESLTLDQARRSDVLVAYEMEGKPLSSAHGGPVRLYVPSMYGYKSCKWLNRITVVEGRPKLGYWEVRGYDVDADVGHSNGRDDHPTA